MERRRYLHAAAVSSIGALAGCSDLLSGTGDGRTVLDPPEMDLSEADHPSYDEAFPSIELPDPLSGEEVSTTQFEGDRTVLLTMFYTNCPDGVCPALLLRLRRAQAVAAEEGFTDDIALLAMTFDPERDTASVLETYADERGVDLDAGNWHFLRPAAYETAEEVVTEAFGLPLEKRDAPEYDGLEYMFPHYSYIFLVNDRGIVERTYPDGATREISEIVADVETVVTA